jgi:UDP-N-acetylglucosamine 2-epimerase
MARPRVMVVVGTRPEAIKLAPVVAALRRQGRLEPVLVATSQHRELLAQALAPFGLVPDIDLDVMSQEQSPAAVAAAVLTRFAPVLERERPAWTVVEGDTTTVLAAALASFYAGVPVAHVEAGLRSGRLDSPFPEELNRRATSVAASLHFAPTPRAVANLCREGVPEERVLLVGNPVVDGVPGVELLPPLGYLEFLRLLSLARFALTDSGGVQEEAPAVKVPVLVLREVTERPEVVESGWGRLVGTDGQAVYEQARRLLEDDVALAAMKAGPNPFGDGHAGERIAVALADAVDG